MPVGTRGPGPDRMSVRSTVSAIPEPALYILGEESILFEHADRLIGSARSCAGLAERGHDKPGTWDFKRPWQRNGCRKYLHRRTVRRKAELRRERDRMVFAPASLLLPIRPNLGRAPPAVG